MKLSAPSTISDSETDILYNIKVPAWLVTHTSVLLLPFAQHRGEYGWAGEWDKQIRRVAVTCRKYTSKHRTACARKFRTSSSCCLVPVRDTLGYLSQINSKYVRTATEALCQNLKLLMSIGFGPRDRSVWLQIHLETWYDPYGSMN